MRRTSALTFVALAIGLAACATDNGIVGGECAVGHVRCGHACCVAPKQDPGGTLDAGLDLTDAGEEPRDAVNGDRGTVPDPGDDAGETLTNPIPGLGDAGGDGGMACLAPLVLCSNTCVDTDTDPMNCGSCGKVCPSNSCQGGLCQGNAAGHVVAVGHDYQTAPSQGSAQARVLSNAVLLPLSNPVRVLSYERYAVSKAAVNVKSIVQAAAQLLGRKVAFTSVVVDAAVPAMLDINSFDVLLVPDQPSAGSGDLGTLGAGWKQSSKLGDFLHDGGVIVVLDGGSGVREMPAFLGGAGLLTTSSDTTVSGGLMVTAPNDAVGLGVISPYIPTAGSVTLDTEPNGGNVVYVVSKLGQPVVVHKVVP
jgi:hypothetical protein